MLQGTDDQTDQGGVATDSDFDDQTQEEEEHNEGDDDEHNLSPLAFIDDPRVGRDARAASGGQAELSSGAVVTE